MLEAQWCRYRLRFNFLARTSRSAMRVKDTYFIRVFDSATGRTGVGECALFRGLGKDDVPEYEAFLDRACRSGLQEVTPLSSLRFGVETALADLANGRSQIFPNSWSKGEDGIPINGLVWMGSRTTMETRIREKLAAGFRCIKIKIGALRFDDELAMISALRRRFPSDILEIRLDANGSMSVDDAPVMLERLAPLHIHSIEQPIRAGQPEAMARICSQSPIPIALDEELIGITPSDVKRQLLSYISPAYIILKPSLCGGFQQAEDWIDAAKCCGIVWWATSALESNIGLNAIAQWVSSVGYDMPQGLGTGSLYTNNISSPLHVEGNSLIYDTTESWGEIFGNWR